MSQFYKLRALSLVFWFVFLTTKVYAQSPEPKDKFLQSLEGIESQIYALPQSSLAQIESLEEDSLLQNQPKDLLIRYWLAKSTVLELLGRDKESLAVVDKGLSLTPEQSQEHLLFKLIQIRAMMGNRDIDTALSSLDALLETSREKGDKKLESEVLLLKGRYYDEQGDYKKSYAALMSSMEAAESSGAQGLVERAALERKQYQALLTMITPLLPEIIESRYIKQQQMELLKVAAIAYAGDKNFELAYQTYGQYHEKFIQFSNQREVENLERQQTLFELERLEYENENLNWNNVLQRLELENNRRTFYLLGEVLLIMIGILLLMALVFLYVNRSRLRMRRLAKTDMLTGLFNRRFLEEWFAKPAEQKPKLIEKPIPETKKGQLVHKLNKQVMRVQYGYLALNHWVERKLDKQKMVAKKPETGPITLVMMDVDHFKQVNDTYGHVFGDVVLTGVAKVLDSSVRESDIVARLGGEEFVIVLPNTDLEEATALAERLRIALSQRGFVTENNQAVNVTCSFGVITSDDVDVAFEALCSQADKLLYEAKSSGRNCVKALSFS
ncbi:TPA: diguanylate cyclase [Vibrio parahaemolyticus]|nr:diguanylate cyclase [Vibrio parahaemolyticus]